jgi:hypothetical protein
MTAYDLEKTYLLLDGVGGTLAGKRHKPVT